MLTGRGRKPLTAYGRSVRQIIAQLYILGKNDTKENRTTIRRIARQLNVRVEIDKYKEGGVGNA